MFFFTGPNARLRQLALGPSGAGEIRSCPWWAWPALLPHRIYVERACGAALSATSRLHLHCTHDELARVILPQFAPNRFVYGQGPSLRMKPTSLCSGWLSCSARGRIRSVGRHSLQIGIVARKMMVIRKSAIATATIAIRRRRESIVPAMPPKNRTEANKTVRST
jgi:hypothetical protein